MRHWLLLLIAAVVVAGIAYTVVWIFTGGEEGLAPNEPDGRAVPLPGTRPLAEADIVATRFDTALRGYRMAQVDAALRRTAYDIGYKQELIDVLEAEVEALRAGRRADADRLRAARMSALAGTDTARGGRHTADEPDEDELALAGADEDVAPTLADFPTAEYEGVHTGAHTSRDADEPAGDEDADRAPADDALDAPVVDDTVGAPVVDDTVDAPVADDVTTDAATPADTGGPVDEDSASAGEDSGSAGTDGIDQDTAGPDGDATDGNTATAPGRARPRRAPSGSTARKAAGTVGGEVDGGAATGDGATAAGRPRRAAAKRTRTAADSSAAASDGRDGAGDGALPGADEESPVHRAASGR
jgi:DivIVA domain-containing protein